MDIKKIITQVKNDEVSRIFFDEEKEEKLIRDLKPGGDFLIITRSDYLDRHDGIDGCDYFVEELKSEEELREKALREDGDTDGNYRVTVVGYVVRGNFQKYDS